MKEGNIPLMQIKAYITLLASILFLTVYLYVDIQCHWANPTYTMVYISFTKVLTPEEIRQAKIQTLQEQVAKHLTWYGFPTVFIDYNDIEAEYKRLTRKR